MGGIRPEIRPRFSSNKSIRAGENLFAWNSPRFRLSPFRFIREPMRGIAVMPIRRVFRVQICPSRAGSQQLDSSSSELH
jgi:hypothetical protein